MRVQRWGQLLGRCADGALARALARMLFSAAFLHALLQVSLVAAGDLLSWGLALAHRFPDREEDTSRSLLHLLSWRNLDRLGGSSLVCSHL